MTKAYSNKALPSGTILREWRLEEVLGVGGFGIVYKGRGIYFDELVAIKEYFPSAISERDAEATVVPIDSDAEEVHALGLKKFVEEAKLLWNLSTPSRHPNIVSVRSLFEIHGTAYMVMDFEDGVSLTDLLKKGEKFDEAKLRKMVLPVASGLERAHRVGVLHRDIKPSNILITGEGQPVLIDFGSARFETEGVTSTTVTFHTPPYAAIEQYIKTYEQGPWTDIYALGVVLYRCITGEKPAEVLERLHGEKEPALVDGKWPGFSRKFLAAVDAAMIIKPSDRPRSLSEWLAMFDDEDTTGGGFDDGDEEATRILPMAGEIDEIIPVKAPAPQETKKEPKAKVPPVPSPEVEEKPLVTDRNAAPVIPAALVAETAAADSASNEKPSEATAKVEPAKPDGKKQDAKKDVAKTDRKPISKTALLVGGAGLVIAAALAFAFMRGSDEPEPEQVAVVETISPDDGYGPALLKLVELGRANDLDETAIKALEARANRIASLETENVALVKQPGRESDVSFNRLRIADITRASLGELAVALGQELTATTRKLVEAAPWADPRLPNASAKESGELKQLAAMVAKTLATSRQAVADLRAAETAEQTVPLAQTMILAVAAYDDAVTKALAANPAKPKPTASASTGPAVSSSPTPVQSSTPQTSGRSIDQIRAELDSVASEADRMANEVIRMGRARDPGRDATDDQKKAYQTLKNNADAARDYKSYLDRLKNSARGVNTPAEAEQLLVQGRQTRQYVNSMILSSRVSEGRLGN